jgi:hypothetical protein
VASYRGRKQQPEEQHDFNRQISVLVAKLESRIDEHSRMLGEVKDATIKVANGLKLIQWIMIVMAILTSLENPRVDSLIGVLIKAL